MAGRLEIRVLGPLEVRVEDEPGPRLPPIRRLLLAVLLAHEGREVTVDRLVEALWSDSPPRSAIASLHVHIHRLRQRLGNAGHLHRGLVGYRLSLTAAEFDVLRFDDCYERARAERHAGRLGVAADLLEQAAALWRAEPYAGIEPTVEVAAAVDRLNEQHLLVMQALNEVRLDARRHHEAIVPLVELAEAHPYVERITALLMLALYRAGRRADALDVYRERRRQLVDEIGVEPGGLLQRMHEAVLLDDDRLPVVATADLEGDWCSPSAVAVTGGSAAMVPRELPIPPHRFTGRERELRQLDALLDEAGPAVPVPIAVITGTDGVGKTALAVHWGHRVAEKFSDGQLFIDLRGYGGLKALGPREALTMLFESLGIPSTDMPTDTERAAARFRTATGDKRVLVVLDNAASVEQVRPLLPAGAGSLVVVTSRRRLGDLISRYGGRRVMLAALPPRDAEALITRLVPGAPAGPGVAALADLCGRLPLALRTAAADLAESPRLTVDSYVALLSSNGFPATAPPAGAGWLTRDRRNLAAAIAHAAKYRPRTRV